MGNSLGIKKISIKRIIDAVFVMEERATLANCKSIFFPEAGALPLKYIYMNGVVVKKKCFSSKITASTKSPLSNQICGILTSDERRSFLDKKQIIDFKNKFRELSLEAQDKIKENIDFNKLGRINLCELVNIISEIGLYIPSQDRSTWASANIIPNNTNPENYSPENSGEKEFKNFKKNIIQYSLDSLSDIVHQVRPLLNTVLSNTKFSKALKNGGVYVMDEAVSRGRTLSVIEIIFKAFYKEASWKIGVLYCPNKSACGGILDYVLSEWEIPPFSNRCDFVGTIIVESKIAFKYYSINSLLKSKKTKKKNTDRFYFKYQKLLNAFLHKYLSSFLECQLVTRKDLIRLLHFIFVCEDKKIIERCLDLNPVMIEGIIEEISFYLNMPHPFFPITLRQRYKNSMQKLINHITSLPVYSAEAKELSFIYDKFKMIKIDYELGELNCWMRNYKIIMSKIDSLLRIKQML